MKKPREINRIAREEQLRILNEIESGRISLKDAARKYGMSPSGIDYWKIHFGMRNPQGRKEKQRYGGGSSSDDAHELIAVRAQMRELKIKLGELYLENEFLKKAKDFKAQQRNLSASIVTDQNLSQFVKRVR